MYCQTCGSKYCSSGSTWSDSCTLARGDYAPYRENYYNCLGKAWTVKHNVTPDNSGWKNKVLKEGFNYGCSKTTYPRSHQTWVKQAPYTTN